MRISVLSAGNAGQAFAGGLTLSGHDVHLAAVPEHDEQIRVIQTFGGVFVEGSTAAGKEGGFAPIARVDTDVAAAVAHAEVIFLVAPAFGQEVYFQQIVAHAPNDQIVVIQPGKFGALRLAQLMREAGRDPNSLLITETDTFLYAAKIHGLDRIWLRGIKSQLPLAALPHTRTEEALETLRTIHPQYVAAPSVLSTSMSDAAYAIHPVTTLLDLSRIEAAGPYRTKAYSITPGVARMVEAVDAERVQVAQALGVETEPVFDQIKAMYGFPGDSLYEVLSNTTVHVDQMTPRSAQHRYVTEEIPYGLVPISEIAAHLGLATPNIDAVIALASTINGEDYRTTGRHLSTLGLGEMTMEGWRRTL
jgi:opine dehydrogenase